AVVEQTSGQIELTGGGARCEHDPRRQLLELSSALLARLKLVRRRSLLFLREEIIELLQSVGRCAVASSSLQHGRTGRAESLRRPHRVARGAHIAEDAQTGDGIFVSCLCQWSQDLQRV